MTCQWLLEKPLEVLTDGFLELKLQPAVPAAITGSEMAVDQSLFLA